MPPLPKMMMDDRHGTKENTLYAHGWWKALLPLTPVLFACASVLSFLLSKDAASGALATWVPLVLDLPFIDAPFATTERLSVMTFNVEEFIEPCMVAVGKVMAKDKKATVRKFVHGHPGMLDQDYANKEGNELLSHEACKHVTNELWEHGVNLVKGVIQANAPDIVLLQELAVSRLDVAPAGYRSAATASTGEAGWKDVRIANAVLVSSRIEVLDSYTLDIAEGAPVPRAAACALVRSWPPLCATLRVCSVHLVGGRFDDVNWEEKNLINVRTKELKMVVDVAGKSRTSAQALSSTTSANLAPPLLIGGDFNAQLMAEVAKTHLRTYPLYKQAYWKEKDKKFLEYMTSGHKYLHQRGFKAAYYPSDASKQALGGLGGPWAQKAPRLRKTSKFGAVVDWIYFSAEAPGFRKLALEGEQIKVIEAVAGHISDHDAVVAYVAVPPGECPIRQDYEFLTEVEYKYGRKHTWKKRTENDFTHNQRALLSSIGMTLPSMIAQWVAYALQVRQTREASVSSMSAKPATWAWKEVVYQVFVESQPGRLLATLTAGLSTFVFWFFFSVAQRSVSTLVSATSVLVSFTASALNVLITNPLWTVITNMQNDMRKVPLTWVEHLNLIWQERGLEGLCAGVLPNLVMILFPVLQGNIYVTSLNVLAVTSGQSTVELNQEFPFLAALLAAIATFVATFVTYPIQVVRTRWQAGLPWLPDMDEPLTFELLRRALFLGFRTKLMHAALQSCLTFTFKEQFYNWVVSG